MQSVSGNSIAHVVDPSDVVLQSPVTSEDEEDDDGEEWHGDNDPDNHHWQDNVREPEINDKAKVDDN